jgi:hypothetical protein
MNLLLNINKQKMMKIQFFNHFYCSKKNAEFSIKYIKKNLLNIKNLIKIFNFFYSKMNYIYYKNWKKLKIIFNF